jgi:zinc transport system ATP-binding protein
MSESAILDVQNVTVRLERETLLDGVSFAVRRGALHAVVGPNGAGKSTLLTAILGQMAFTGRILAYWRADGRIGYVPQGFAVDRTLPITVEDFLALTRQRRPICFGLARTTRHRIAGLLDRVGLSGFEERLLSVLSGGELRRVLLANALDPAPELLILDEPAGGLDQGASAGLEDVLVALKDREDVSVLMVSHDLHQVRRIADRVTVLDRRLVFDGPPAEALGDGGGLAWLPASRSGAATP